MLGRSELFSIESRLFFLLCCMSVCFGCTQPQVEANATADAQAAFDRAATALSAGNYSAARGDFDAALKAGGLTVDNYVEALLGRAMCLADAGEFDAAMADITQAEQGVMEPERLHVARGFLLIKKGDAAAGQAEYAAAKKLNPKVTIPQ
jgi:tetratricopeptide (TPR) repeat protein